MREDTINPPVRGDRIGIKGPFLEPRKDYRHLGTDFGPQTPGVPGDDIVASTPGKLVHRYKSLSYGNVAVVERDNGDGTYSYFVYAHMADPEASTADKSKMLPKVEDDIEIGQRIGQMSNTGTSRNGKPIPVHAHFEQLDFSRGWPFENGRVDGVTPSGIAWERVGPSFQLPNGWVANSDNGRISVTVPPMQAAGAQQIVPAQPFQYPDIAPIFQQLITGKYFGGSDRASGIGANAATSTAKQSSVGPGPIPYLDATMAAQRLFEKVPPSNAPLFPCRRFRTAQ